MPLTKMCESKLGGDAAALLLQAACLTPAGWEAKVTLLKEGFTILEKIPGSGFLEEKKWGHPALAPVSPGGMCLARPRSTSWDVLLQCPPAPQQSLSGISLHEPRALPHQQQFKL